MKKIIKNFGRTLIISSSVLLISSYSSAQTSNIATGAVKAVAKLSSTCSIGTQAVNFGVLNLPLSTQSTTGSLNVFCSNQAAYTIGLAYGGVYGQGSATPYLYAINSVGGSKDGYSYILTVYSDSSRKTVITPSTSYNAAVGQGNSAGFNSYISSQYNCSYTGSPYSCSGIPSYSYGIMTGATKGDKVAYSISVPGDSTKVWNSGNSSYTGTGNADTQTLSYTAKIVPASSSNQNPAPDFYTDTVIATVTY